MKTFKDLSVWQKSMKLVENTYQIANKFPRVEEYGLVSQMKRCCISIPLNLAEGFNRRTTKEYIQFVSIAYGSCSELETQLEIAHALKYISKDQYKSILFEITEVSKMLNGLIRSLSIKISH